MDTLSFYPVSNLDLLKSLLIILPVPALYNNFTILILFPPTIIQCMNEYIYIQLYLCLLQILLPHLVICSF